mmetsp:Transcript_25624/g.26724  ORF Transcript_25624/g.26724 Transcript_25624/m.26724 type:complete len:109 (+) Transcript_25624:11-337(+)
MIHNQDTYIKRDEYIWADNYGDMKDLINSTQLSSRDEKRLYNYTQESLKDSANSFCNTTCKAGEQRNVCLENCLSFYKKGFASAVKARENVLRNVQAHNNVYSNYFMY